MTQFTNCPVKRLVQEMLFKDIKAKYCLGLAGPNPEQYLNILKQHSKNQLLCDFNPTREYVLRNSLNGAYDFNAEKIDWIDADFCSSIITNGDCLIYLYNRLKHTKKEFWLTFNFSMRGTTISRIKEFLSLLGCHLDGKILEHTVFEDRKYIKVYQNSTNIKFIQYRDSGDNMFSGLIHVKQTDVVALKKLIIEYEQSKTRHFTKSNIQTVILDLNNRKKWEKIPSRVYTFRYSHPDFFNRILKIYKLTWEDLKCR